jgi:hypothetical protein
LSGKKSVEKSIDRDLVLTLPADAAVGNTFIVPCREGIFKTENKESYTL